MAGTDQDTHRGGLSSTQQRPPPWTPSPSMHRALWARWEVCGDGHRPSQSSVLALLRADSASGRGGDRAARSPAQRGVSGWHAPWKSLRKPDALTSPSLHLSSSWARVIGQAAGGSVTCAPCISERWRPERQESRVLEVRQGVAIAKQDRTYLPFTPDGLHPFSFKGKGKAFICEENVLSS